MYSLLRPFHSVSLSAVHSTESELLVLLDTRTLEGAAPGAKKKKNTIEVEAKIRKISYVHYQCG